MKLSISKGYDSLKVYLDNCCFNRPYDDQTYLSISIETQAKLHIQDMIRNGSLELISSYILDFENSENPFAMRRKTISDFLEYNTSIYVSDNLKSAIEKMAEDIKKTGIKHKDACHVACAIMANADYFISTDYRLLKYKTGDIKMMNPVEFIRELEVEKDG
jgi:predicted nucleic acid-binding protein